MKKQKKNLALILAIFLFFGSLTVAWAGEGQKSGGDTTSTFSDIQSATASPSDATAYIDFGIKLEKMVGQAFVEIESMGPITEIGNINDDSFYRATIDWKVINPEQTFHSGDYFTFKVPSAFGNKTIDMVGSDNMAMGKILIDSDGNATATFNDRIAGLTTVSGEMQFTASIHYELEDNGTHIEWIFDFGDSGNIIFEGTANLPVGFDHVDPGFDTFKFASYNENTGQFRWNVSINEKMDPYTGTVGITDTYTSGMKMSVYTPAINTSKGEYGIDASLDGTDFNPNASYFAIYEVDYDTMREYYNENLAGTILPTGKEAVLLADGEVSAYMRHSMKWMTENGKYKFMKYYTDEVTVNLKENGFTMDFPENVLYEKSLYIAYFTEVTSAVINENGYVNTVAINDTDHEYSVKSNVTGVATTTGKAGQLILYKQDSNEQYLLKNAKFTIADEQGNKYTGTTDQNGKLVFEFLSNPANNYSGTYTLTEVSAPDGYILLTEPITLILNDKGAITNGAEIYELGLGRVSLNGYTIIVYNVAGTEIEEPETTEPETTEPETTAPEETTEPETTAPEETTEPETTAPEETTEPETTAPETTVKDVSLIKVDADDHSKGLEGAVFHVYRILNGKKQYLRKVAGDSVWSIDTVNATRFMTGENGKLIVENLEMGTYYFTEISAPYGYYLSEADVSFVIDATNVANNTVIVEFENRKMPGIEEGTGSLLVRKTVTGNAGSVTKDFTFTLKLFDGDGVEITEQYSYVGSKTGTITSGGTFTLKHGESITINNLPVGTKYTLSESNNSGYAVSWTDATGTIAEKKISTAECVNKKNSSSGGGSGNSGGGSGGGSSQTTPPPTGSLYPEDIPSGEVKGQEEIDNSSNTNTTNTLDSAIVSSAPKTGDNSSLIALVLGLCGLISAATVMVSKRAKKES